MPVDFAKMDAIASGGQESLDFSAMETIATGKPPSRVNTLKMDAVATGQPQTLTADELINHYSEQYGVNPSLVKAHMAQESNFNFRAYRKDSQAGGAGQFIPRTWYGVAKQMGEKPGSRFDPDTMIRRTAFHLADLYKKFGSEDLASAAYKAGEGAVRAAGGVPTGEQRGGYDRYVDEDTQDYVNKINRWKQRFAGGQTTGAPVTLRGPTTISNQDMAAMDMVAGVDIPEPAEMPVTEPFAKDKGTLAKMKDTALKVAEAFNAVNAGTWAGVYSLLGAGEFKDLYRQYQDEGSPAAAAFKGAGRAIGIDNKYALAALGFAGDILGDPLTYTGFGLLTKTGKAAKAAKGAAKIAGSSKKIKALNKILAEMAPEARRLAPTLAEQARAGQRALVTVAGKPVIKGAPVLGAIGRAGKAIRPAGKLFMTGAQFKDPKARKVFNQITKESRFLKTYFQDVLDDSFADITRRINKLDPTDQRRITEIIENPELFGQAERGLLGETGKLATQYDHVKTLSDGLRKGDPAALQAIGADNLIGRYAKEVPELTEEAGIRYVPHVIPDEFRKAVPSRPVRGAAEFSENIADEVARKLVDAEGLPSYTIKDINRFATMSFDDIVKEGVPKATAGKIKKVADSITDLKNHKSMQGWMKKNPQAADTFFSTNPGFIAKTMSQRTAKSISGSNFRTQIGKAFGKTADEVMANPEQFADWVKIDKWNGTPQGKLLFDPEIAADITRTEGAFFNDETTKGALKAFDNVQNFWKAWTLFPFPAYHNRNWAAAVWNNSLAGMNNPKYYQDALQMQYYDGLARATKLNPIQKAKKAMGTLRGSEEDILQASKAQAKNFLKTKKLANGMTYDEALTLARQQGIRGKQLYEEELITGLTPTKNFLSSRGPVIRAGQAVGAGVEDNVRLSHFMWRLDEGDNAFDAAQSVMKYQFDYGDITPFERNVMSRAMPFYRFTSKNIPLQVQVAATRPGVVAGAEKARRQLNTEQDVPAWKESLLQDYLAANIPVQIGTKSVDGRELPRMFALGNWFPTQTAMQNVAHPLEQILGLVTPFAKIPIEQAANYDFFRKRPLVDVKRGRFTRPFLNQPIPARAKHLVQNMRILNEADRLLGPLVAKGTGEESKYVLRSAFKPSALNQAVRLTSGVTLSPWDATEAKTYQLLGLRKQLMEVQKGYRSAARRKDTANMEASLARFKEIQTEIAALAGITQGGAQ